MIPSRDIKDQKILKSNWMRGTPGHTQRKVVITVPSLNNYLQAKKQLRYQLTFSQNVDKKNPAISLERHHWAHTTKTGSLKSSMQKM